MANSGIKPSREALSFIARFNDKKCPEFRALIFDIVGDKIECTEQIPALAKDSPPTENDDILHAVHVNEETKSGYYMLRLRIGIKQTGGTVKYEDEPFFLTYISDDNESIKRKMTYSSSFDSMKKASGETDAGRIMKANDLPTCELKELLAKVMSKRRTLKLDDVASFEGVCMSKLHPCKK